MANNIFAPPTASELESARQNDMFRPPTGDELKAVGHQGSMEQFIDTNIDALPMYGQAAGSLFGPVGAGAGQAAGESLKNTINAVRNTSWENEFRLPTRDEVAQVADSAVQAFNTGATAEMGGRIIGKGIETLARPAEIPGKLRAAFGRGEASGTQSQAARASAQGSASSQASASAAGSEAEQGGQMFSYRAPKNLDELNQWEPATKRELPQRARLQEIEAAVPDLQTKPLKYHYAMFDNPKAMKDLKLQFENLPTASAKKIADYNQQIVNESGDKVRDLVRVLADGEPKSLGDAGESFLTVVRDKNDAINERLGPAFDAFKAESRALSADEAKEVVNTISGKSKIGHLIDKKDGKFFLNKNTPRTGVSDDEYRAIRRVVMDLNDGMTFQELQRTREFLRKQIDPMNPGATPEIARVRRIMLSALEDMAGRRDVGVGEVFKEYAKNQQALETIEKIVGGNVENLNAIYAANPDRVVQKIFANPNYAAAVREYVGPQTMNDMTAAYIDSGIRGAFDSANGFNPVKLRQWIKSNQTFLKNYVDPRVSERLSALADYGYFGKRFLDEVNPSGTAASLKAMLEPGSFWQKIKTGDVKSAVLSQAEQKVTAAAKQRQAQRIANEMLGEVAPRSPTVAEAEIRQMVRPESLGQIGTRAAAAAISAPQKGPERWMADGARNLQSIGIPAETVEKLRQSKQGQALLIRAQGIGPNSKAMQSILKQIGEME